MLYAERIFLSTPYSVESIITIKGEAEQNRVRRTPKWYLGSRGIHIVRQRSVPKFSDELSESLRLRK